ncbi:MAG: zinc ribbon domain-containing protein [Candidatus Hermodarchaeota archaeon]
MISQNMCDNCGKENKKKHSFCVECGAPLKGKTSVEFQIIENLKVSMYGSIVCLVFFVAFMVLVTIAVIFEYGLYGYISIPIIWPLTILGLVWASCYMKGLSKYRKFIITKDYIEIIVPHKEYFRINWSAFDEIIITKRESMAVIPTGNAVILGPRFVYFTLIFKGKSLEQNYEFESGKDFKVRSRKKILFALEKAAKERGKGFTDWKWKDQKKTKN